MQQAEPFNTFIICLAFRISDYQLAKVFTNLNPGNTSPYDEQRGLGTDTIAQMQLARKMIRDYTSYVLSAFKDFGAAEIEEVTLKFGMKLGGSAGIPYITEGKAESNLEIEVKCKFPDKKTGI
ncbi:CU044_2847 family protein [Microcoleus sp. FACHB-672]|uniref:CU044_2847 family protein n=1 Tax=Microcoleus sp. FACHB-672 TaxID=2692825 RepID=UPI002816194F|nr:CU044_2847 family protein [Microcoleus sp. FACHB-672]